MKSISLHTLGALYRTGLVGIVAIAATRTAEAQVYENFKILDADGLDNARIGWSVATNGSIGLTGGVGSDAVYAFDVTAGLQVLKLQASDGPSSHFGGSMAIDGNTAIVGAFYDDDNGFASGSAYLFDLTSGQQLAKLLPSDGAPGDEFSRRAVAIDGSMALVGAYRDDDNGTDSGSVYVFEVATGQQLAKLLPADGAPSDSFGIAVAIEGTVAVVGASNNSGSAYVFDVTTGQEIMKLLPTDGGANKSFGSAVAISGMIAVVGAFQDNENGVSSGSAYVFDLATGKQIAKLLPTDGASSDWFGLSVGISENTAVVGALDDDDNGTSSGSAYLFDWSTGQQIAKLLPTDGDSADQFGSAVAIQGSTVIVGANGDDENGTNSGAAYLYGGDCNGNGKPDWDDIDDGTSQDCDFNGQPDECQLADPANDWNGDGVLDSCTSANYCDAENNSTGPPAVVGASGSPIASDNAFTLEAWDLPLNEFAYFLASESTAFIPGFGGSDGNLCLGAPQYRFNVVAGGGKILNSGATGTVSFTLDLNILPQGITFDPGETWYFQLWYRDFTTGPTSNTTDGIEVMFR